METNTPLSVKGGLGGWMDGWMDGSGVLVVFHIMFGETDDVG
jgi:hypothetical protein